MQRTLSALILKFADDGPPSRYLNCIMRQKQSKISIDY